MNGAKAPKIQPFSAEIVNLYVDRLIRYELLKNALGEEPHPCLDTESILLREAEFPIRASANACRRSPTWPMLKTWFSGRFKDLASGRLTYYNFPPTVGNEILDSIMVRGFDHLLEGESSRSGVRASPGSNVLSSRQCKTS